LPDWAVFALEVVVSSLVIDGIVLVNLHINPRAVDAVVDVRVSFNHVPVTVQNLTVKVFNGVLNWVLTSFVVDGVWFWEREAFVINKEAFHEWSKVGGIKTLLVCPDAPGVSLAVEIDAPDL